MKTIPFFAILLFCNLAAVCQKQYHCEYSDTIIINTSDSLAHAFKKSIDLDETITEDVAQLLVSQLMKTPLWMNQKRIVRASLNRTIISIDRSSREGKLNIETFDSCLYKDDELYLESSNAKGFSDQAMTGKRKEFIATGKTKEILKYVCKEYVSSDSTTFIWVSDALPQFINPGIRTGNIKGAVLGFILNTELVTTKCMIAKIENVYK